MKKQIEKTISHIKDLEKRLGEVDNNLRYIKVVQALKKSMDKLYSLLLRDTALQREYQSTYIIFFYGGSLSFTIRFVTRFLITSTAIDLSKMSIFLISEHFHENQSFTN